MGTEPQPRAVFGGNLMGTNNDTSRGTDYLQAVTGSHMRRQTGIRTVERRLGRRLGRRMRKQQQNRLTTRLDDKYSREADWETHSTDKSISCRETNCGRGWETNPYLKWEDKLGDESGDKSESMSRQHLTWGKGGQ